MKYLIRSIFENEVNVLDTFLYEAIFIPEGVETPPRDVIMLPELQVYVKDFGKKKGDNCFIAVSDGVIVGAVWVRIMNDYGHMDDCRVKGARIQEDFIGSSKKELCSSYVSESRI